MSSTRKKRLMTDARQLLNSPQDAYTHHKVYNAAKELLVECDNLRAINEGLVNRLAAACEVLGRIANKTKLTCPTCKTEWTT
jgi:hypothetical protein